MISQTLGHYRIVAKIGAGGMGEVYRAHDEQLDRDVALKVLPLGTLVDDAARKRFRKEALALAKLNHPNIETVFEFGNQGGVDFLAMELIPGASLGEKLKAGPLLEQEVIRLATQFAEGLAAAHAQGIVHRDLKPGNLMLTSEGRLKILDFGLATLVHPEGDPDMTRSITETTSVSGTLPYMSPEQLRGQPVDARSDIYAAGAVLYEMAAGRRPFPHSQSAELIGAILHQTPTPPSAHNRRISPALESVVMKALDKEPTRRYQSARELLVALEGFSTGITPATHARPRWSVAAAGILGLLVILLIGLTLRLNVGGWRDRMLGRGNPSGEHAVSLGGGNTAVKVRRSVAVLGFKNLSGRPEEAWLSTALSEMLTTELAAGEQLRTIPGENVAQTKISLSLPDADGFGKETLTKIRNNLNTDDVVLGSYVPLGGGQIRLDLRLQDTVAGETLAAVSEKGSKTQLDNLVSRAGAALRAKLGAGGVSTAEAAAVKASLPSNPEAARLYSQGLAKLREFDALGARELLEKAVAVDPNHALAHSALAAAWSALGYDGKAQDEAKKAFELSASLSREERLSVEGRYREATRERGKAVEIYRTLWGFFPDNLEYGLRLAAAQNAAGKAQEALVTVEALRKLPLPASGDSRIDLAEGEAAESVADYKREQLASARAVVKGTAHGAGILVARGRLQEGWALRSLGESKSAMAAFEDAKRAYAAVGERGSVAASLNGMGTVLFQQGDWAGARKMFEASLATRREIGDKRGMASSLNSTAGVLFQQGDLAGARKMFEASLATNREIGDKRGMANNLNNIAGVLFKQGDRAGARKMYEASLAIQREVGNKNGAGVALFNIGSILHDNGDLVGAKRTYEESLAIGRQTGDKSRMARALHGLGQVFFDQGDLVGARKSAEEALAIRNELNEKQNIARSQLSLASLAIEEGRPSEGEFLARKAVEEFHTEHAADAEAEARAVLARSSFAQNQEGKAQEAVVPATEFARKSQDPEVRFLVNIVSAPVRAALGNPTEAMRSLEATLAEAKKYGFVGYELQARLALGEIEIWSGKTAAGRAHLAALEKDATAKGFLLVARKAAAASK